MPRLRIANATTKKLMSSESTPTDATDQGVAEDPAPCAISGGRSTVVMLRPASSPDAPASRSVTLSVVSLVSQRQSGLVAERRVHLEGCHDRSQVGRWRGRKLREQRFHACKVRDIDGQADPGEVAIGRHPDDCGTCRVARGVRAVTCSRRIAGTRSLSRRSQARRSEDLTVISLRKTSGARRCSRNRRHRGFGRR